MMRTNKKLFDQIFELKYLCKQLNQHSNKCEQEERAQKKKAKAALEKGNMEGAKIHASNAIRKKGEALNYLKLASRLDAVISRLDQQNTLSQVNKSASGITKNINRLLSSVPTEKMASVCISYMYKYMCLLQNSSSSSLFVYILLQRDIRIYIHVCVCLQRDL